MSPHQHNSITEHETAPLGIKIYCVIVSLIILFGIIVSLGLMSMGGPGAALGTVFLGFFIAYLIVLYGLWTLKSWGWTWGMILLLVGLLDHLFSGDFVGIVISALLIAYLWSKREYYRE
jgi:hypothetical protein